jgi:hypothetical protein
MTVHGDDMEELFKAIPKRLLPEGEFDLPSKNEPP